MYSITFSTKVKKKIDKLDRSIRNKIFDYLSNPNLRKTPKKFGKILVGDKKGLWRYRTENYRIICEIKEKEITIFVVDVDHRSKVYKK